MTIDRIEITKEEANVLRFYGGIESVKKDIERAITERKELGHKAVVEVMEKELLAMDSLQYKIMTHLFPEGGNE